MSEEATRVVETNELGPIAVPVKNQGGVRILGGLEIICGIAIVVLEMATLIMFYNSGAPGYLIEFAGLWAGTFAVITGIIEFLAARENVAPKTRRWLFLGGIGASLVCLIQAAVMAGLTSLNIYLVRSEIAARENRDYVPNNSVTTDQLKDLAMLKSVTALVYIVLLVFAMITVGLDCCNVRRKAGELEPDQVVYTSVDGRQVKEVKIYRKAQHIKS